MQRPWLELRAMRQRMGWTQQQAAAGVLAQSELSQIERGRVIPSALTIRALALRYGVDAQPLLAAYVKWRQRESVRARLWRAAQVRDGVGVRRLLDAHGEILSEFEREVYGAYIAALAGELTESERRLEAAWQAGLADALLTNAGRTRVLAVEARTHYILCLACHRFEAAAVWYQRLRQRLTHLDSR
jgi:transcriptional regulator with XRE-family HTH domain